jgi:hypothetical protein
LLRQAENTLNQASATWTCPFVASLPAIFFWGWLGWCRGCGSSRQRMCQPPTTGSMVLPNPFFTGRTARRSTIWRSQPPSQVPNSLRGCWALMTSGWPVLYYALPRKDSKLETRRCTSVLIRLPIMSRELDDGLNHS